MSSPHAHTCSPGRSKKKWPMTMQSAMACRSWTGIVASTRSEFAVCSTSWIGTGFARSGGGSSLPHARKRLESVLKRLPWESRRGSGVPKSASVSPTVHEKSATRLDRIGFLLGASSPCHSRTASAWRKGNLSLMGDKSGGKLRVQQKTSQMCQ